MRKTRSFYIRLKPRLMYRLKKQCHLILDVDHAVKWVPYMGSVKVLSRDDKKGEFQLYMVLDFPFPLKDSRLGGAGENDQGQSGHY